VTGISEAQSGLSARAGIDGMIGGELLARFRLVIDYAHQWIVFESENDIRRRFEYDMSGLILLAEGPDLKKYVVRYVLPNSPAADAALQVNDVISSVDGKSTSQLTISTIAVMFSKPGQTYHLVIKRGGNKIRTKLKPRPLV
jgi:membrane-associated protease RseP (regulator of RpoE activity)